MTHIDHHQSDYKSTCKQTTEKQHVNLGIAGVLFDLSHHDCLKYCAVLITSSMITYFAHMTEKNPPQNVFVCIWKFLKEIPHTFY